MMKNKFLLFILIFVSAVYGQRPAADFLSEIVVGKQDTKGGVEIQQRFSQNQNIELDLNEQAFLIVRKENAKLPYQALPLGAYVNEVAMEVQFQGKIYEANKKGLTKLNCETTPSNFAFRCSELLPNEVRDKLTTRNISDLKITVRLTWRTIDEVDINCKGIFPTDLTEKRIDIFTINVKHFGLNILVDVTPIANNTNGAIGDIIRGFFNNLAYSGIDYAFTTEGKGFTNILLTTPVIKLDGRHWWNKNIEGQATVVKSFDTNSNVLGYGVGFGFFGESKILKTGVYWYPASKPNFYVGLSIIGLAKWITNANALK